MALKPLSEKQTILDRLHGNYQNLLISLIPNGRIDSRKEYHHLCPFHMDHHLGNASTNTETGMGKCFACDTGWDIFHLVGKLNGLSSFQEQLQKVAELTGGELYNDPPYRFEKHKNLFSKAINPSLVECYTSNLTTQKYNYLEQYRAISRTTVKKYKIGFNNQRFTIPIFDQTGRIINIRKWLPPESRQTNDPKIISYNPGYGSPQLYPVDQLGAETLILTEGELDALSIISTGFAAITITGGAASWKDDFTKQIVGSGSKKIIVCMDNDDAGSKGAKKRAAFLAKAGLDVIICKWPSGYKKGFDVTDLLNKNNGKDILKKMIDQARPFQPDTIRCNSINQSEIDTPDWPVLDPQALFGLAGEFVQFATENSEADPAAVLATFLVQFGVEIGREPVFMVGDTPHRTRLASVIVGASSKARKGTSARPVLKLFHYDNHENVHVHARVSPGPFSSGEGIIYAVRDQMTRWNDKKQIHIITDPGIEDKRLFVLDEEFAGALANTRREGNTLSMVLRAAWDSGNLDPLTKTVKIRATGAHVGWVSHITLHELGVKLSESEGFNGFANRILWVCARRNKRVPFPEPMDEAKLQQFRHQLLKITQHQNKQILISLNATARHAWADHYYDQLSEDQPGLLGCITNRAEAQVLRLAMIYCLLDKKYIIDLPHLKAALAFWDYCRQSARYIFYGQAADKVTQKVLEILSTGKKTGREIFAAFSNNISKTRLEASLKELIGSGKVVMEKQKTGNRGRPTIIYELHRMPDE